MQGAANTGDLPTAISISEIPVYTSSEDDAPV